jgi:hypothetical protein
VSTWGKNKHSKLKSLRKDILPSEQEQELSSRSISLAQKEELITLSTLRIFSRTLKKNHISNPSVKEKELLVVLGYRICCIEISRLYRANSKILILEESRRCTVSLLVITFQRLGQQWKN